jgi:hypothetical protein
MGHTIRLPGRDVKPRSSRTRNTTKWGKVSDSAIGRLGGLKRAELLQHAEVLSHVPGLDDLPVDQPCNVHDSRVGEGETAFRRRYAPFVVKSNGAGIPTTSFAAT